MSKATDEIADLAKLGTTPSLTPDAKLAAFQFVGLLYGESKCMSLNSVRVSHVIGKKRIRPRKLPPKNDSFVLHLLRCIHQLIVWRSSLIPRFTPLDPLEFGYTRDTETGLYTPQLMTQSIAPPELLSDLVCKCGDLCAEEFPCCYNEQPCTEACGCKGVLTGQVCENLFTMLSYVQTSGGQEDDDLI